MPSQLAELEFHLDDVVGGQPLTPGTVDLPTLRGFLEDLEKLVKGNTHGATLADSRVRIEAGSLRVVALVSQLLAADFRADMMKLDARGDLDAIQPHRADVLEQWQSRTRRFPSRTYSISVNSGQRPLRITHATEFQHGSDNAWVSVEKYLVGKVVDAGGKQDPNLHLVLAGSGETVRISATEQQLSAEKDNQLYKDVTLRVLAEQHLVTKELRNRKLLEFSTQAVEANESVLAELWRKGHDAWRDVASAVGWVESLRGNQ